MTEIGTVFIDPMLRCVNGSISGWGNRRKKPRVKFRGKTIKDHRKALCKTTVRLKMATDQSQVQRLLSRQLELQRLVYGGVAS